MPHIAIYLAFVWLRMLLLIHKQQDTPNPQLRDEFNFRSVDKSVAQRRTTEHGSNVALNPWIPDSNPSFLRLASGMTA